MPFSVTQKTLERLEWPSLVRRLAAHAGTPRGREQLARWGADEAPATPAASDGRPQFESSRSAVEERLAETAEARAILDTGDRPPLAGVVELGPVLARARKSGTLAARELLDLAATLAALRATARFLALRSEQAPRLADLAASFSDQRVLESEIERCLDPAGEVRDDASRELADARREAHQLGAEIQGRLDRLLRDTNVTAALSDRYFTVRNDRYVLPVRADARGQLRGIVHDASGSGTTLFVEPEALVELNNRHKRAEIAIERERRRVLQRLSAAAAAIAESLESELEGLASLDLAFARAALAEEMDATAPQLGEEGVLRLPQLRHPALPLDEAVANDVCLGEGYHVLVISGPNAGGKTVMMKAVALAALLVRAGMQVPAAAGSRVDLFDAVLADIGDEQSIGDHLSTFSAHMENTARIVEHASAHSLVVLDEIGVGTDPSEGAALAQAILETLADTGARVIATTHYGLLKEMADVDTRFANASVEFDAETLAPTYRLHMGFPGSSSATAVAARMGMGRVVLERAHEFLEREDRQLDRMLSDLATSRAALEREQREATRLRAETEATRNEYREKLTRLQERRDKLYHAMRDDLDRGFKEAHARIAGVIRDLQRGGTARDAAQARERLADLADETRRAEQEAGLAPQADEPLDAIDWRSAKPGDPVQVVGGGSGVLRALPDRRGRVMVGLGSARVTVPMERVGRATRTGPEKRPSRPAVSVTTRQAEAGSAASDASRCDIRGLRVDEALDQLLAALDRAAGAGRARLVIVHGIGKGALRQAVRSHLADSAYVARFETAPAGEGGDGATIAHLA